MSAKLIVVMASSVELVASDEDLCERLSGNDQDALAELYDRNGARAFGVALRIAGSSDAAEDIVQTAFIKLWREPSRYCRERGSFKTWFLRVVTNLALDQARRDATAARARLAFGSEMAGLDTTPDPFEEVADRLGRADLRSAMSKLPRPQRQVLELAYFGDRSGPEIAVALALPLSTIKGRMRLGLQAMRRELIPSLAEVLADGPAEAAVLYRA